MKSIWRFPAGQPGMDQASILVFEHLGNLQPEKGKYSRRGNTKRAYWMKGRIFRYSK